MRAWRTKRTGLALINAAMSSSCGNVNVFKGVTRDLDITWEDWRPSVAYKTAPHALGLASANTCREVAGAVVWDAELKSRGSVVQCCPTWLEVQVEVVHPIRAVLATFHGSIV